MKKILFLTLCLALACSLLAGCEDSEPFQGKTYTPDGPVREIALDVRDREIQVCLSPDDQVHLEYAENSKEFYTISLSDEGVLTMASASGKEWTDYLGGKAPAEDRKITLEVPDGLLQDLDLSTTNGDILLPSLSVSGSIALSANGGDIAFESLGVGSGLSLDAKNGDISGAVAGSYEDFAIRSQSKKGESNLPGNKEDGDKSLEVSCNNGDIRLQFTGE